VYDENIILTCRPEATNGLRKCLTVPSRAVGSSPHGMANAEFVIRE
jgi:hypothetical protein